MKPLDIRWHLQHSGKTQAELADYMEMDPALISRLLNGKRKLKADEADKMRTFFGEHSQEGVFGFGNPSIPEIDVRAGVGGGGLVPETYHPGDDGGIVAADGVLAQWGIPADWINHAMRANASHLRIVEVMGDSNYPTLLNGDRVFIDTHHRVPSPPGLYALWDGIGVVVKRVELIPNSDPVRFKLISDNPNHTAYEVDAGEANIIGRVCGRVTPL